MYKFVSDFQSTRVQISRLELNKVHLVLNFKSDEAKGFHTFEISSWEDLQARLRIQFLPSDIEWKARDALHNLRHIGTLMDFIKAHSSLMLQIRNMSEADRLYYFIKRLKP